MAIGRSHFNSPAPVGYGQSIGAFPSMAGWSEERKRFFEQNGYDRGPDPVQQGGILMGEGNILQRKRGPETTVRVTETPPDDPTPTKRVTTTKYPEDYPAQAGGALAPIAPEAARTATLPGGMSVGEYSSSPEWQAFKEAQRTSRVGQPAVSPQFEQPGMQGDPYAGLLTQPREVPTFERDQFTRAGMGGFTGGAQMYDMAADPSWSADTAVNVPSLIGGTGVQYEGGDETDNLRGVRNNNPFNMKITDSAWEGKTEGTDTTFETFSSPELGIRAAVKNTMTQVGRGNDTIRKLINVHDPASQSPDHDFVDFVARRLGVSPDEPLDMNDPSVMTAYVNAVIAFENAHHKYDPAVVEQGVNMGLGAEAAPVEATDPRFARWLPGEAGGMVDPNQLPAGAMGRNRPPEYFDWREEQKRQQSRAFGDVGSLGQQAAAPAAAVAGGGPIVSEPMLTAPGTFEGSRRSPPVPAGMLDTGEGVVEQSPEALFGPQDLYATAGAPEEEAFDAREALAGLISGENQVLFVDDDTGQDVTMDDILLKQTLAGRFGPGLAFLKRLPPQLRLKALKDWWKKLGGRKGKTKPKEKTDHQKMLEGEAARRGGAQTTAEAANAARVAGTFAPIRTGIKTGLKVAAPVAAVGLLDEGSEEERAAGEWPGLVELEDMPWWLKRAYDASRSALGAVGKAVTGKGETLVKGLKATEEDLDIERAKATASPSQRYEGLLSAAKVAGLKPSEIAEDLKITHEKGLAGSTFTKSERHRLEAAKQYKEAEIKRVAAQDAEAKQADLDRYYANFPEDVEGKRERYLKALNQIYKKVAILNVIAALTNSPSQAGAFMQLAAEKFKTLEGFKGEERLQKIARGVFFDENGVFDAPVSKQDAFNKAMRFGANHDEALELSGHQKDATPSKTETGVRIWYNTKTGQEVWMTKDQAPTGPDWLPKQAPTEKAGTEFERQRKSAIELINAGNEPAALGDLKAWLVAKNSMMQMMPDQATIIAQFIIDSLKEGMAPLETEIDTRINQAVQAGVKSGKIDLGEI